MKRLLALLSPAILLGGCVALPYDTDSVYYPATVSAQVSSGYYYSDRAYPYTPLPYSRPYPSYPSYPYYQPPVYIPPAPVIVPPPRFDYNRNRQPGWQQNPLPRHDAFRNRPRPEWTQPGTPRPQWGHGDNAGREWRRPEGGRNDWRRDERSHERGDGRSHWQHDGQGGNFRQR